MVIWIFYVDIKFFTMLTFVVDQVVFFPLIMMVIHQVELRYPPDGRLLRMSFKNDGCFSNTPSYNVLQIRHGIMMSLNMMFWMQILILQMSTCCGTHRNHNVWQPTQTSIIIFLYVHCNDFTLQGGMIVCLIGNANVVESTNMVVDIARQ